MFKLVLVSVLFCLNFTVYSQFQSIKGYITDKESQLTIPGAIVSLITSDKSEKILSDSIGFFKFQGVHPGRYDVSISYFGYKFLLIPNVIVTAGKEVMLDVLLEEQIIQMGEIVVKGGDSQKMINELTSISGRSFSTEEVNRYAGGRSDPSRLAANFAGVNSANDARNDLIIRGNSPTGVLWRIAGLKIPNPNHFSTIGTTGGPVSAINTNMLKNSDFFTSAFPTEYGNATAGVFDLNFRDGNSDKHEHLVQFGLITGLEVLTEGPIIKARKSSYLISYRHGLTGLAQGLGFNIGTTASPFFQDFSFKFIGGTSKLGKFSLIGLAGNSEVRFELDNPDTNDLFAIPNRNSFFTSKIRLLGLSHFIRVNEKSFVKTIAGISSSQSSYDEDSLNSILNELVPTIVNYTLNRKYILNSSFNSKVNTKLFIKLGVIQEWMNLQLFFKNKNSTPNWVQIWDFDDRTSLMQVYAHIKYAFNDKLVVNSGIHFQQFALNNSKIIEPRFGVKYHLTEKNTFSFGYGLHSQLQPLDAYFFRSKLASNEYVQTNKSLDFTKSNHFVIGYDWIPIKDWRIKSELYYQSIFDAPVSQSQSSFSLLNAGATFNTNTEDSLVNKGSGENKGIELTIEKFYSRGFYTLLSGTIYESSYKGSDGIKHNTAFNTRFVYNVLFGGEIKVGDKKNKTLSFDLKFTHSGGRFFTPIDLVLSQLSQREIVKPDNFSFSERNPEFIRLDLKIGITLNSTKRKITNSLFIDINNVTNHKNVFAQRYSVITNSINTAYQIGFFPNLIYRLLF